MCVFDAPAKWRALGLACVLALIFLWRWQFIDVPLERDEGEYAYFGQLLRDGGRPYVDAHNMKFPGVYFVYAAVFSLFDDTPRTVRLTATFAHLVAALFLYLLARRWFAPLPSLLGVATFGLLASGLGILGFAAKAEHFVLALALPALWLVNRFEGVDAPLRLACAGILLGCAVLMKQSAVVLALAALPAYWAGHFGRSIPRLSAFFVGLALPLIATMTVLAAFGAWRSFWFWTVVYAQEYGTQIGVWEGLEKFARSARYLIHDAPLVYVGVACGLFAAVARCRSREFRGLWWLLVASWASPAFGWRFSEHYFLPAVAGAGLLVAGFTQPKRSRLKHLEATLMAAALFISGTSTSRLLRGLTPEQVARLVYHANPFSETMEVGRFLAARMAPNDLLAVLGSEPQIYFYAARRAATSYVYMYPLMEPHPYAEHMQKELIRQLEARKPRFVVLVNVASSWRMRPESPRMIFQWSEAWVNSEYQQIGLILMSPDGPSYIFWDEAAQRPPAGDTYLAVFQRRP